MRTIRTCSTSFARRPERAEGVAAAALEAGPRRLQEEVQRVRLQRVKRRVPAEQHQQHPERRLREEAAVSAERLTGQPGMPSR